MLDTLCCMFFLVIMLVEISSPMHWNELAWTIDEGLHSASTGNTPPPPFFFPAKQSFHLWSFTSSFQGKPTKYLSNICLEQYFKIQLETKNNGFKWISDNIEFYSLSPFPSNHCRSTSYKLPFSFLWELHFFFFLLFISSALFSYQFI